MTKTLRATILTALVAMFVLGVSAVSMAQITDLPGMDSADEAAGGGMDAAAIGELGSEDPGPCVEDLMDLPALNACVTANGAVKMDLPALDIWSGPGFFDEDEPAPGPAGPGRAAPDRLPVTGVNVGDFAAFGLAALSGGGFLLRRLRLSLAS